MTPDVEGLHKLSGKLLGEAHLSLINAACLTEDALLGTHYWNLSSKVGEIMKSLYMGYENDNTKPE